MRGEPETLADALVLRNALDPLCVLEAALYRKQADIRDLRRCMTEMRQAFGDDLACTRAIWQLHRRIAQIGRNKLLREISLGLLDLVVEGTESIVPGSKPPAYKLSRIAVHEALVDAIESGNEAECARVSAARQAPIAPELGRPPVQGRRGKRASRVAQKGTSSWPAIRSWRLHMRLCW